jgi:hypothetical protein
LSWGNSGDLCCTAVTVDPMEWLANKNRIILDAAEMGKKPHDVKLRGRGRVGYD